MPLMSITGGDIAAEPGATDRLDQAKPKPQVTHRRIRSYALLICRYRVTHSRYRVLSYSGFISYCKLVDGTRIVARWRSAPTVPLKLKSIDWPSRLRRYMKMNNQKAPLGLLFALALLFAVPAISLAQGRGNGRGQGPNLDKKCAKFVNCHDARDGRWDGRGPAINTGTVPINQPPILYPYPRNGGPNSPIYYPNSRNRRSGRDDNDDNNQNGNWRRRRHDSNTADPNNQNRTWRQRRTGTNNTETRRRHVHQQDGSKVID
jgi:hypothetical protein